LPCSDQENTVEEWNDPSSAAQWQAGSPQREQFIELLLGAVRQRCESPGGSGVPLMRAEPDAYPSKWANLLSETKFNVQRLE